MDSVSPPASDKVRQTLRSATLGAHARLHENAHFAALLGGEMSMEQYRLLLLRLFGLHAPIEILLAAHNGHPLFGWRRIGAEASRAARLRADLAALGLSDSDIAASPTADALLPPMSSPAAALGCAWVVEGSAAGGRVMARRVGAILGHGCAGGGLFLSPDPARPASWRGCCDAVEACGKVPNSMAVMADAAMATFAAFETWLG